MLHTETFSRVWLKRSSRFAPSIVLCHFAEKSSPWAQFMSHAQCTWLGRIPLPPPHSTLRMGVFSAIRTIMDSLAVLPNKVSLQVMSPTIPSRSAVRRLRLCSYHQEERALGRLTTLARTSLLPLHHRKWMKDKICECWLHRCSYRREGQVQPH